MKAVSIREQTRQWEAKLSKAVEETYCLRLYVTGSTPKSIRAITNIKRICEEHLKGRYILEVIDIYQQPVLARGEQIIAAPTLIKRLPLPLRKFIGDMTHKDRILLGLDLRRPRNLETPMEKASPLKTQIKELRARLAEAEETLQAIRSGEVDALVVSGAEGDQVFTLQGAEMPYRILVEEMNQGALMLTPEGTILYANTRFASLSKTPLEQVIGASWQQFFAPENGLQLASYLTSTEPISPREELSLAAADGSPCPIQLSLRSMSASGVAGFSVIVTDLTERRQSEDSLRKISEELLQKNLELGAFSFSVSHDMRAPLRTMQGFAKILLEDYGDKLEPQPKSYLEKIVASTERLSQLIHDVLAYSQLAQGQKVTGTFDLDRMVREMVESYPNLGDSNIEIATTYAPVIGYEVALSQCLFNLLCNALKYVSKGVVPRVKVWTERLDGHVRLLVQDNGIGIAPKNQQRIFDAFTRLHTNEAYEGTGLGLSMVKRAVEKMGGTCGVESELGKGSRFWIQLQSA